MSPSGRLVFFAGNQSFTGDVCNTIDGNDGTIARFSPTTTGMGICVDSAGVVYLADTGNHKVKKIWSSGKTTSMAGVSSGFANGTGGAAQFNDPTDVCVDGHGNLFVADRDNNRIRKITESGVVTTLAGTAAAAFTDADSGSDARFSAPVRICMDPSNQFFYVMDSANAAIRKVHTSGKTNTFCSYNVPTGSITGDICVDNSGFLYILEKV
jgi:sugar lactone lactonase YvrE